MSSPLVGVMVARWKMAMADQRRTPRRHDIPRESSAPPDCLSTARDRGCQGVARRSVCERRSNGDVHVRAVDDVAGPIPDCGMNEDLPIGDEAQTDPGFGR